MNKTEKEIEFLKIKKQNVERVFDSVIDNYKHSAIYILALVVGFAGILLSLGYTNNIYFYVMLGLGLLGYKFIMMLVKVNELNKREDKIDNSIIKRLEKLGVDIKSIEKEIN